MADLPPHPASPNANTRYGHAGRREKPFWAFGKALITFYLAFMNSRRTRAGRSDSIHPASRRPQLLITRLVSAVSGLPSDFAGVASPFFSSFGGLLASFAAGRFPRLLIPASFSALSSGVSGTLGSMR